MESRKEKFDIFLTGAKGISQIISTVIIFLITTTAIGLALLVGTPVIDRAKESVIFNEAIQNMKILDNAIKEVASEGKGSFRAVQLRVSGGEYKVSEKTNTMEFTHVIKSGILESGTFAKEGNVFIAAGTNAKASKYDLDLDGTADIVLENEIMRVGILNNATSGNGINTSRILRLFNLKESGLNATINDSSITIDNRTESTIGTGVIDLVREGEHLATAEAVAYINTSIPANFTYNVVYTLRSGADFLIVKIQNVSDVNSSYIPTFVKFNFDYKLIGSGSKENDVYDIGTINETLGIRNVTRQFATTHGNLTNKYVCTFNRTGSNILSFSLIHSGKSDSLDYINFTSLWSNSLYHNNTYTAIIRQKIVGSSLIIPFTKETCKTISDNYYLVADQEIPSKPFGSFDLGGEDIPIQIYSTYDRVQLNGTDRFGVGSYKVCLSNEGVVGGKPRIWARVC